MPDACTIATVIHQKNCLNWDMCMCVNVCFAPELKWESYKALLGLCLHFFFLVSFWMQMCGKFRNVACGCCAKLIFFWHLRKMLRWYLLSCQVFGHSNVFFCFKTINKRLQRSIHLFTKHAYSLSCQKLDDKINTTLHSLFVALDGAILAFIHFSYSYLTDKSESGIDFLIALSPRKRTSIYFPKCVPVL